jgi:DNA-binding CsgD family transcriptional regulator
MASPQSASETSRPTDIASNDTTDPLTARQLECLSWVQEGKTSWEIGQIMGISPRTVESYLAIAFSRLEVRTRIQAVLRARDLGLI